MTDKQTATSNTGQPVNVTITQPDRAGEGAKNVIAAREWLDEQEAKRPDFEVGGRKMTSDEFDAEQKKAAGL